MDPLIERCAGIDVHKATMVVTVRVPGRDGRREIVTQTFGTMMVDLLALRDWLQAMGSRMWPSRAPASTGGRCTTCWKMASRCCWST